MMMGRDKGRFHPRHCLPCLNIWLAPQDSAGGKTGSTKSGGGILDFFGGSSNNQSAAPQPKSGVTLASSTFSQNSGLVYLLADAGRLHDLGLRLPRWSRYDLQHAFLQFPESGKACGLLLPSLKALLGSLPAVWL